MLFSEVYGTYYNVLAELLTRAVEGELTKEQMYTIIQEKGFEESILTIPENLESQVWPLLAEDMTTPLDYPPTMPLTQLQKRWMKSLTMDPRFRLFHPPVEGLEDVLPLYPKDAFVYFDQYHDGDPYEDPEYIAHFQTILRAIREKRWLEIRFQGGNGVGHCWHCIPYKLEYSLKDDKFRMITANDRVPLSVNVARLAGCTLLDTADPEKYKPRQQQKQTLVLELTDHRNALERCMLHFSHLEKETERLDENHYRLTLRYEKEDETEILIRVLSFGPLLEVVSPEPFRQRLRDRLKRQMELCSGG